MINEKDVFLIYGACSEQLEELRKNLICGILNSGVSEDLENSSFSKEMLLRIKYIVAIHDEIEKNFDLEIKNFRENPAFMRATFYRGIDYLILFEAIRSYQRLIFICESYKRQMDEFEVKNNTWAIKPLSLSLSSALYEIDDIEEGITTRLTKILEKGKER